jgi:hypothetical protein
LQSHLAILQFEAVELLITVVDDTTKVGCGGCSQLFVFQLIFHNLPALAIHGLVKANDILL